jgi:hypothetical protein
LHDREPTREQSQEWQSPPVHVARVNALVHALLLRPRKARPFEG